MSYIVWYQYADTHDQFVIGAGSQSDDLKFLLHSCIIKGCLKEFSTGGAQGILCGVMKLKNPGLTTGREYGNMLSQEKFEFQPIWDCILGFLHQTHVVITRSVPNAASNYNVHVLIHPGMK